MNVPYRVKLSQTERAELMALLSGGRHAGENFQTSEYPQDEFKTFEQSSRSFRAA